MPTPAHMLHQNEPVGVKLLVLGVASVGKTSLIHRFTDQQWLPEGERNPTIGVDTWVHKFDIKGKRVVLNIWDTAGDERLRALTTSYYRGTQGIILVYDVTNRESFETISWWFAERSKLLPVSAVKMIVGNKADKLLAYILKRGAPSSPFSPTCGRSLRRRAQRTPRMSCLFLETSAKTDVGVSETFRHVVERILKTSVS
ncbi:P-loop containing nucleoside triphosphate hydrolase protein [Russula dissimulans]|nr:P-loop containing nucleoside triphosphate hydrolase protein [Russula dissimulans]